MFESVDLNLSRRWESLQEVIRSDGVRGGEHVGTSLIHTYVYTLVCWHWFSEVIGNDNWDSPEIATTASAAVSFAVAWGAQSVIKEELTKAGADDSIEIVQWTPEENPLSKNPTQGLSTRSFLPGSRIDGFDLGWDFWYTKLSKLSVLHVVRFLDALGSKVTLCNPQPKKRRTIEECVPLRCCFEEINPDESILQVFQQPFRKSAIFKFSRESIQAMYNIDLCHVTLHDSHEANLVYLSKMPGPEMAMERERERNDEIGGTGCHQNRMDEFWKPSTVRLHTDAISVSYACPHWMLFWIRHRGHFGL